MRTRRSVVVSFATAIVVSLTTAIALAIAGGGQIAAAANPNIILIMVDDMGYGDPGCYNPQSKIQTPNIDRLAKEGMRFTDAHAAASVCVPSRYALLTGRYPFRRKINERSEAVIEAERLTLPKMLKEVGYDTAMVGKWHLGFDDGDGYKRHKNLQGGPIDRGFDSYFGIHSSLDFEPYYYVRDRDAVQLPTGMVGPSSSAGWTPIQGAFWRGGRCAPDFKHNEVTPQITSEAVNYIDNLAKVNKAKRNTPFFLYVAFPSPHTPWLPLDKFNGKSGAGMYGDFVMQVDHSIGQILNALDRINLTENTLVLFMSDNGPVWYDKDKVKFGHSATGSLRGMKGDAWEAGHRLPFIARWPAEIAAGKVSDSLLCYTDVISTCAAIVDYKLPRTAGEDSFNQLPVLKGAEIEKPVRTTYMWGRRGHKVMRVGNLKLITQLGSGGFSKSPKNPQKNDGSRGQLYDLRKDLGEQTNLWLEQPELVEKLTKMMNENNAAGRSVH
ncbi:MAG: arylsulfatase A [Pirellulaceae bacterium]|jgi:arylsulfatase A